MWVRANLPRDADFILLTVSTTSLVMFGGGFNYFCLNFVRLKGDGSAGSDQVSDHAAIWHEQLLVATQNFLSIEEIANLVRASPAVEHLPQGVLCSLRSLKNLMMGSSLMLSPKKSCILGESSHPAKVYQQIIGGEAVLIHCRFSEARITARTFHSILSCWLIASNPADI